MRISTRIRSGMAIVVILVVAISAALGIGSSVVRLDVERNDRIATVLDGVFELSVLTVDYLAYDEPRAIRQWQEKYASLGAAIEDVTLGSDPADIEALESIRERYGRIGELFDELVEVRANVAAGGPDAGAYAEHADRIVARMLIGLQEMVSEAIGLSERTSQSVIRDTVSTFTVVLGVALVGVGIALAVSVWTERSVIRPLVRLSESARQVGAGDLKHRTGLDLPRDEVGDLGRAFDAMIEDVHATYEAMQQEVIERRQAETELRAYRERLEAMVSERTRELSEALVELEDANDAKNRFMASMTHELRTPLNSIIGFTGVILGGLAGPVTEEQRRQLEMVRRSGEHLLALISDLLDLARIEAGHLDIQLSEFVVGEAIESIVSLLAPLADKKGLSLTAVVEPAAQCTIRSDAGKVEQILINLIENAIKFTERGTITVEVYAREGERCVVVVRDTGRGIPATDLPHVFERFHRVTTGDVAAPTGTGLGLEISRSLAQALGGSLMAKSVHGEGSVFTLELPVDPEG